MARAGFLPASSGLKASAGRYRQEANGHGRPAGAIVPPIDWPTLAHELVTQRGRATRLELVPLADELRQAIRWRVARLTPLVASPAYAPLWLKPGADAAERRQLMLAAVFESGDFHYGASNRERRQTLARWLHARLANVPAPEPSA